MTISKHNHFSSETAIVSDGLSSLKRNGNYISDNGLWKLIQHPEYMRKKGLSVARLYNESQKVVDKINALVGEMKKNAGDAYVIHNMERAADKLSEMLAKKNEVYSLVKSAREKYDTYRSAVANKADTADKAQKDLSEAAGDLQLVLKASDSWLTQAVKSLDSALQTALNLEKTIELEAVRAAGGRIRGGKYPVIISNEFIKDLKDGTWLITDSNHEGIERNFPEGTNARVIDKVGNDQYFIQNNKNMVATIIDRSGDDNYYLGP